MAEPESDIHPDVAGFVLEALSPAERDAFEAHLGACARCREELRDLRALPGLLDEAVPAVDLPPELRARTLAAVAAAGDGVTEMPGVTDLADRRRRRAARLARPAPLLAVAAMVAGLVLIGTLVLRSPAGPPTTEVALAPNGIVQFVKTDSGWRIKLDMQLPRRDNGRFYQAFLEGPEGRVSIGTFNEGSDVTLWSGVPPSIYKTFVIVEQPVDLEVLRAALG